MKTKICPTCKEEKSLSEYWMRKSRGGNQPASRCKKCSNDKNREWRNKNPEYEKIRYAKDKEATRERQLHNSIEAAYHRQGKDAETTLMLIMDTLRPLMESRHRDQEAIYRFNPYQSKK